MQFFTYIMASGRNGTLYVGMTNDLVRRTWEHREHLAEGFTKAHGVTLLVWFEVHATAEAAITREKALKHYKRGWKRKLIETDNPGWNDLYPDISGALLDSPIKSANDELGAASDELGVGE